MTLLIKITSLLVLLQGCVAEGEQLLHDVLGLGDGAGGDLIGQVQEDEHEGHDEGELVAHYPLQRQLVHQEVDGRAAAEGGKGRGEHERATSGRKKRGLQGMAVSKRKSQGLEIQERENDTCIRTFKDCQLLPL